MIKINIKEIVERIETRYKARYKNLIFKEDGLVDTEGQLDAVHFHTRDQLKGAKKLLILLSKSRTMKQMLYGEVKKDESDTNGES